jgi:spore coat protein U-like protein
LFRPRKVFSLGALALLIACAPAAASELDPAASQRIQIHGNVTQHCGIGSPGNVDFGNLERDGLQADLAFALDCNVPFVMNVEAQNGALTNLQYPSGQGPYAGSLPYVLDFSIPARSPSATVIRQTFNSHDLIGGKSISSQGAIATDGMQVHVTLGHAVGEAGLLAGNYGETITITMSSI